MRHLVEQTRAQAIITYALNVRMHNPELTAERCLEISREMHELAERTYETMMTQQSDINVGDIVKCINNQVQDPGYEACLALEVGRTYKVVTKTPDGKITVDSGVEVIEGSFYPDRFEKQTDFVQLERA